MAWHGVGRWNANRWNGWPWSGSRWSASGWIRPTDIPATEADALKLFYDTLAGDGWTNGAQGSGADAWGDSATANDWFGITVTAGHVTGLALPNNALSGDVGATVPTTTETLDLGQNTGITDIDVSGLTSADNIDLAGCGFGQAVVSGILEDVVTAGVSAGTLDIGGSNSAAQPAGVAALQTLEADSWTLTYSTVVMENTGDFFVVTADGSAAFRSSATDLSGQTGKYLVAKDSAGKYAEAYIDAADSAEALGAELIANGDFSTTDNWSYSTPPFSISGGVLSYDNTSISSILYSSELILQAGLLVQFQLSLSNIAGITKIGLSDTGNSSNEIFTFLPLYLDLANGTYTYTGNVLRSNIFAIRLSSIFSSLCNIDDVSLKIYTHLGTDAVTLESDTGEDDGIWTSVESGFNPGEIELVEVFNE